ncbi:hypothetical protein DRN77_01865 [Methanosarcinales archaeon]|nr:MAG: hypothetical protein DRN77_01865 [Methanosarcinales archaeon]
MVRGLVLARALVATASAVLRHASQSQAAHPLMQPWTDTSRKGDLSGRDGILAPADAAIALRLAGRRFRSVRRQRRVDAR